jgi:hypothetical protein
MSDNQEKDDQRKNKDRGPWEDTLLKILRGFGITLGILAVVVVLVFGLALGACFLAARR